MKAFAYFLILSMSLCLKTASEENRIEREQYVWLWDADSPPKASSNFALLTEHIVLSGTRVLRRARQTYPNFSKNARVTPLVHVEFDILHPPPAPVSYRDEIVNAVLHAASRSTSGWVQLDYEARPSHRVFYRNLVRDIKRALPSRIKLSVTALAWWCMSSDWLNDLDADEVVPMFFRMGQSSEEMMAILKRDPERLHLRCRAAFANSAVGFSVQEMPPQELIGQFSKIYWFNYSRWKEQSPWPPVEK